MAEAPTPLGYIMSTFQLDELWRLDMNLAHLLMDLPLRTCTAKPTPLPLDFPAMDLQEFQLLKAQVRRMWVVASLNFKVNKTEHGWGLFMPSDSDGNSKLPFSNTNPVILGWLAKAPDDKLCETGHRYLRSPCDTNIYLGGPISLANYDPVGRVICRRSVSLDSRSKHKMLVYKAPGKSLLPNMEIVWTYNFDASAKKCPSIYKQEEWELACCLSSAGEQAQLPRAPSMHQATKKQKLTHVASARPHKTSKVVQSFTLCTYCGENLSESLKEGEKVNLKRHWALKHAVALVLEMGVEDYASEHGGVCGREFIKHLDLVDQVYQSLKSHGYKIIPACNFFDIIGYELNTAEISQERKKELYDSFVIEGASNFKNYQILYLNGVTVPTNFSDLLKADVTNFDKINWMSERPSSNNFSLKQYQPSQEEIISHAQEIKVKLTCAVMGWLDISKF